MRIVRSLKEHVTDCPTLLTIGKFDGFHRGHQLLIRTAIHNAKACNCCSAVLTFHPHPAAVIHPDWELRLLISLEERIELIRHNNPDLLIIAPFTHQTMQTTAYDYMHQICEVINLQELWVGTNFYVGRNREGNIQRLMEIGQTLGYTVGSVSPLRMGEEPISSTRVRTLLKAGQVEEAQHLLGRPFSLHGRVVQGDQRGRTIGFPTANLAIDPLYLRPANGVYACYVCAAASPDSLLLPCTTGHHKTACRGAHQRQRESGTPLKPCTRYPAVVNVGIRPTFHGHQQTVEAHLLDWSGDLYGQDMRVAFLHHLRGEQRFSSIEALKEQIARDATRARALLSE